MIFRGREERRLKSYFILDALEYYRIIIGVTGFRWNDWNLREATKHDCEVEEIEAVTRAQLSRGAVGRARNGASRVEGRGVGGRPIEVIFVYDPPDASAIYDETVYVIHAMPLTTRRRKN